MVVVLLDKMKDEFDNVLDKVSENLNNFEIKILSNEKVKDKLYLYSNKGALLYDALIYFRQDYIYRHIKNEIRCKNDIINRLKSLCGIDEDEKILFVIDEECGKKIMTQDKKIEKILNIDDNIMFSSCEYLDDIDDDLEFDHLNYKFLIV